MIKQIVDIDSPQQFDLQKKMQAVKQELAGSENIKQEEYSTEHGIKLLRQNGCSGNRQHQDLVFSYFHGDYFPFLQSIHYYAGGYKQWQPHQQPAMIPSVKQETVYNDPVLAQKPADSTIESEYCPSESSSYSIRPKIPKKVKLRRQTNHLLWTLQENRRYLEFIKQNKDNFQLPKNERRSLKLNLLMSLSIKSRNAQQCRSHHQKVKMKYGSIEAILNNFEKYLNEQRREYKRNWKRNGSRLIGQIIDENIKFEDREKMQDK